MNRREEQLVTAGVGAVVAAGVAYWVWRHWGAKPASTAPAATTAPNAPTTAPSVPDEPVVAPAYPYLSRWTEAERRALLATQQKLGLDVAKGALPGVIQHESRGDPTEPKKQVGTPRGGLIQLTQGANLPGFTSADAVWAVRSM